MHSKSRRPCSWHMHSRSRSREPPQRAGSPQSSRKDDRGRYRSSYGDRHPSPPRRRRRDCYSGGGEYPRDQHRSSNTSSPDGHERERSYNESHGTRESRPRSKSPEGRKSVPHSGRSDVPPRGTESRVDRRSSDVPGPPAPGGSTQFGSATVRISGIPESLNKIQHLVEFWGKFGEIINMSVVSERTATVTYTSASGAENATAVTTWSNHPISVSIQESNRMEQPPPQNMYPPQTMGFAPPRFVRPVPPPAQMPAVSGAMIYPPPVPMRLYAPPHVWPGTWPHPTVPAPAPIAGGQVNRGPPPPPYRPAPKRQAAPRPITAEPPPAKVRRKTFADRRNALLAKYSDHLKELIGELADKNCSDAKSVELRKMIDNVKARITDLSKNARTLMEEVVTQRHTRTLIADANKPDGAARLLKQMEEEKAKDGQSKPDSSHRLDHRPAALIFCQVPVAHDEFPRHMLSLESVVPREILRFVSISVEELKLFTGSDPSFSISAVTSALKSKPTGNQTEEQKASDDEPLPNVPVWLVQFESRWAAENMISRQAEDEYRYAWGPKDLPQPHKPQVVKPREVEPETAANPLRKAISSRGVSPSSEHDDMYSDLSHESHSWDEEEEPEVKSWRAR
eukprot:GHVO01049437.1.p1 GENE.GHVO01049437.1~~GHVO01049437.1.p1  ORF type:complete len:624 (+),score=74.19 GHVO01049437.1:55-1926(+)